ncbi:MAG TPA: ABC transporter ATP-binding protein, partial [Gemmataceae bacterium]|nr:ABC transporter ATP-binding protein [Gemmataceae bacterium]
LCSPTLQNIPMMDLVDVTKTYQQGSRTVNAVRGVSMSVTSGEFVSIMGPSGSGKSTLLHLLGALDTPTSGEVFFKGDSVQKMTDRQRSLLRRNRIGFVFQFFNLIPTLKAEENVALPLLLGGMRRSTALKKGLDGLARVGLTHRVGHYPEEMSGGEMQRVAIARALVNEPEAIMCDEPTGNLDSKTSGEILELLRSLPEAGKCALVMVTHDRRAAEYGDRVVHIKDGLIASEEQLRERPGRLVAAG